MQSPLEQYIELSLQYQGQRELGENVEALGYFLDSLWVRLNGDQRQIAEIALGYTPGAVDVSSR